MKHLPALLTAALTAAFLGACNTSVEETSREYPITTGRYLKNLATPKNANFYLDYDQESRLYLETQIWTGECPGVLYEGSWFVYTNADHPETVLKKKLRRAAGSASGEVCQTRDSLKQVAGDFSESYWIRNIRDSSFETCDRENEICFGKCSKKSDNPGDACFEYDSTRSMESYWDYWRKH